MLVEPAERAGVGEQDAGVEDVGADPGTGGRCSCGGRVVDDGPAMAWSSGCSHGSSPRRPTRALAPRSCQFTLPDRDRARKSECGLPDSCVELGRDCSRTGLPKRRASPLAVPAKVSLPGVRRSRHARTRDDGWVKNRAGTARQPREARDGSGAEAALALGVGADARAGSPRGGSRASRPRRSRTRCARSARAGTRRAAARRRCGSPGRGRAGPWCRGARRCARRRGSRRAPRSRCRRRGVLLEQRPYGVRDLAPPAVADRDVDDQAVDVAGRVGGLLELARPSRRAAGRGRRPGCSRHRRSVGEAGDRLLDDRRAAGSSSAAGRLRLSVESSHSVTTSTPTSSHHSSSGRDVRRAGAVAVRGVAADGLGPAAVAVEHHARRAWAAGRAGRRRSTRAS